MAPLPTAPAPQPPPDLPADPKLSDAMSNYLRTFALWCRKMFQDKLDANAALPGILLQAYDKPPNAPPSVFMLEVSQAGHLALAPAALGSGDLGTPVPIGSGDYLPLSGGSLSGNLTVTDTVFAKAAAGNAAFCVLDSAGAAKGYFYFEKSDGSTRMTNSVGQNALVLVPNGSMNFQQGGTARLTVDAGGSATFTGQVVSNATLYSLNGNIVPRQAAGGGNAQVQFQNNAGTAVGFCYWQAATNSVKLQASNGAYIEVDTAGNCSSNATFNPLSGAGFRCKAGVSGAMTNTFNINWTGTAQLWIDSTNLGTISIVSDYRIKKDIEDLDSTWDLVKDLRPIRYTHKDFFATDAKADAEPLIAADDIERWGFVAHELQETLIESAANGCKDCENEIQSPNPWTVIAALTKTVQELQARVEALEQ